jgi:hypothetical protein
MAEPLLFGKRLPLPQVPGLTMPNKARRDGGTRNACSFHQNMADSGFGKKLARSKAAGHEGNGEMGNQ